MFLFTVSCSMVALYAAIVATIVACVQIANFFRDRAKVKVRFQRDMEFIGDPMRQGIVFTLLEVVNAGRRPVTITNVTMTYLGGGAIATDVMPRPPFELTEGKQAHAFLDERLLRFEEIRAFQAHDAVGRTYRAAFAPWYRRAYWFFRRLILGKKKRAEAPEGGAP
jgi:hypothetical protein